MRKFHFKLYHKHLKLNKLNNESINKTTLAKKSDIIVIAQFTFYFGTNRHRYLGKHVSGFIKSGWRNKCRQYAYEANLAKFSQNKELMKALIETRGNSLAEASPYDRIWGIGLSLSNPKIYDRLQWRGKNLAGEVLESVRTELLKQSS
jgi:ribA/ribD-fused uncharacterized protein